ncbi:MAG TPA: 50S ribosomal protein L23 [Sedimentisphaerales bacterium]|nr:50S ribosomal protein L23 [Sedimentisphaerales bacterium]
MNDHNVIVRPVITEQSTHLAGVHNAYAFEVNRKANKTQIKNAVERLYSVKVIGVRTANHTGKPRRRGRMMGQTASWKKAVVVLAEDYKIDLF